MLDAVEQKATVPDHLVHQALLDARIFYLKVKIGIDERRKEADLITNIKLDHIESSVDDVLNVLESIGSGEFKAPNLIKL